MLSITLRSLSVSSGASARSGPGMSEPRRPIDMAKLREASLLSASTPPTISSRRNSRKNAPSSEKRKRSDARTVLALPSLPTPPPTVVVREEGDGAVV